MAIQYHCSNCGQPIEVDDEHAGQTAACPYCHHLIGVPHQSTYQPHAAVAARPTAGEVPPVDEAPEPSRSAAGWDMPPAPRDALAIRQRLARIFGTLGLICTGIVLFLLLVTVIGMVNYQAQHGSAMQDPNMTPQEIFRQMQRNPPPIWLNGAPYGAMFFAVVGLVLGIVSVTQSRVGNWRGWTSLLFCGVTMLCGCGTVGIALVMFTNLGGGG